MFLLVHNELLKLVFLFLSQNIIMLWVLKRTISMRRFFWAPKTNAIWTTGKKIFTFYAQSLQCYYYVILNTCLRLTSSLSLASLSSVLGSFNLLIWNYYQNVKKTKEWMNVLTNDWRNGQLERLKLYAPTYLVCKGILYEYYIPCAGDSRKYHPEECYYQPRRSRGW